MGRKWIKRIVSVVMVVAMVFSGAFSVSLAQSQSGKTQTVQAASVAEKNRKMLFSSHGKLSVKGTNLVDEDGKAFQLRGISTHGLSWFPQYVNKKAFKQLRDKWGCNVVRLAMYTGEYNGYCTGDEQNRKNLEKLVQQGVKYATELDMYVIIDWHILSDGNPNTYLKESKSFFKKMSKKYKNNDHVLYEICNEPNGGVSWSDVRSYATKIVKTIRKNDKDKIIIIGSPTWSQDVDVAAQNPVKGKNLVYSLHFYASTHKDWLRQKAQTALDQGLALMVTEFGICDASGNGWIDEAEANRWIEFLDKNNISYMMWSFCNKAESASILKPECTKTYGFRKSDLSQAGLWLVKTLKKAL